MGVNIYSGNIHHGLQYGAFISNACCNAPCRAQKKATGTFVRWLMVFLASSAYAASASSYTFSFWCRGDR